MRHGGVNPAGLFLPVGIAAHAGFVLPIAGPPLCLRISPEALYATKRAVNRVGDAAGFRSALYAGLDVVGPLYAAKTELGARFREIAATEGVPAAVRWRSAQFKE